MVVLYGINGTLLVIEFLSILWRKEKRFLANVYSSHSYYCAYVFLMGWQSNEDWHSGFTGTRLCRHILGGKSLKRKLLRHDNLYFILCTHLFCRQQKWQNMQITRNCVISYLLFLQFCGLWHVWVYIRFG